MIKNIKFNTVSTVTIEAYSSGEGFQEPTMLTLGTLKVYSKYVLKIQCFFQLHLLCLLLNCTTVISQHFNILV